MHAPPRAPSSVLLAITLMAALGCESIDEDSDGVVEAGLGTNGLTGRYYNRSDLTRLRVTRVDQTINFDWASGSPHARIEPDTFSVHWSGQVRADATGVYTF